ncbi:response regulator [Andreprevotia chitinilytica]|uniref:response regulator n=1 Tax=Andreprevotia chitinilytica TaxID=396808 RepID=UPI0005578F7A|nr:response regulator [Andreprevotia chitinilytica]
MSAADQWLIDDRDEPAPPATEAAWHILIVDDEPDVHKVTQLALMGLIFRDRRVETHSCYSGQEAIEFLSHRTDIALALIDVVMESDDAGLRAIQTIRELLGNHQMRIILRTGEPGAAPSRFVIENYDINCYKAKTELTRDQLYTAVFGGLRSYHDLMLIEYQRQALNINRQGLMKVNEASQVLYQTASMIELIEGVMTQLQSVLFLNLPGSTIEITGTLIACGPPEELEILQATGSYAGLENKALSAENVARLQWAVNTAIALKHSICAENHFVGFFESQQGRIGLFLIEGPAPFPYIDQDLIELFFRNVSVAYESLLRSTELEETQRSIIYTLSEVVENRSQDTGYHIHRMAEYSYLLAKELRLPEEEAAAIRMASPLHDIGKVGIPDYVLHKPGALDAEERKIMDTHAQLGYQMLNNLNSRVLQIAAIIAHQHHEKWDGTGYPNQLSGDAIHIAGRISALTDVYDALSQARCYKAAWPRDKVLETIQAGSGSHFDPAVVAAFFRVLPEIEVLQARYAEMK